MFDWCCNKKIWQPKCARWTMMTQYAYAEASKFFLQCSFFKIQYLWYVLSEHITQPLSLLILKDTGFVSNPFFFHWIHHQQSMVRSSVSYAFQLNEMIVPVCSVFLCIWIIANTLRMYTQDILIPNYCFISLNSMYVWLDGSFHRASFKNIQQHHINEW